MFFIVKTSLGTLFYGQSSCVCVCVYNIVSDEVKNIFFKVVS